MRLILSLLALPCLAAAAAAQEPLSLGPLGSDAMTCAQYEAMDDGGRIGALRGVEPFGDDIGAEDEQGARDWADEVARQCAGHGDRSLSEAAALANQTLTGN